MCFLRATMQNRLLSFFLALSFCFGSPAVSVGAHGSIEQRISELEPFIGGFPPNVKSKEDLKPIEAEYDKIKADLDKAIRKNPEDLELVFLRGRLGVMGHNFDKKGAWKLAESDLLHLLRANPNHERALVEIGRLYVNTDPTFASKAQEYFNRAQAAYGSELLEPAQQGLFFCFYYQGRLQEALQQADLLRKKFPGSSKYQRLYEITREVLERKK